jgi:hypothetical protein
VKKSRTTKVDNKTTWQTRDLKAIIVRVARKLHEQRRPTTWIVGYSAKGHRGSFPNSRVEIKQNSNGTYRAHRPNDVARIYVPKRAADLQPVQFAIAVYETIEFGSYRGPSDDLRRRVELNQEYAWADSLPMRPKPPKTPPTADEKRSERRQSVVAAIKRWQTKQKRATTALRKLRTKLRRIDRNGRKTAE